MSTAAIRGVESFPLVPAALERSGQREVSRLLAVGIAQDEVARALQGVETWRQRYNTGLGRVPAGDAHAWKQASYFHQAVQNNFILQQLRAGLATRDTAVLRRVFEQGKADGGLRESVGAMSSQELHALATHLDSDGPALGSRQSLAEHLITYPGVRLEKPTVALLRASLAPEHWPRFDALYR